MTSTDPNSTVQTPPEQAPQSPAAPAPTVAYREPFNWRIRVLALISLSLVVLVVVGVGWWSREDLRVWCIEQQREAPQALKRIAIWQLSDRAETGRLPPFPEDAGELARQAMIVVDRYRYELVRQGDSAFKVRAIGVRDNVVGDEWTVDEQREPEHVTWRCRFPGYTERR